MKKMKNYSLAVAMLVSICAFSQEVQVTDEERIDASPFPSAEDIGGNNLERKRDNYLKKINQKRREKGLPIIKLGFNKDGSYIGWKLASIEKKAKSVDFAQKRVGSFLKAFTDAKGDFVQAKKQTVTVSIEREFFHDDRDDLKLEVDGTAARISKKLARVAEVKLDKMLKKLGVNPQTIGDASIEKKRQLAKDAINKEVNVRAVSSVSGIIILKTFEDLQSVGVLIKQKSSYASLAKAIASRKLVGYPAKVDPVAAISEQLEQKFVDDKMYVTQFGVRNMVDEAGNRVLVSYGQWSPKITKNDSKMKINMAIKAAREIAHDEALSYMTQFINTTLALDKTKNIKDSDEITEITKENEKSENETSSVGAIIDKLVKENSNVTLEGVSSVKTWTVNHPETGHLVVGTVLMWSPLTQEAARQKTPKNKKVDNKPTQTKEIPNKVKESVEFDYDF